MAYASILYLIFQLYHRIECVTANIFHLDSFCGEESRRNASGLIWHDQHPKVIKGTVAAMTSGQPVRDDWDDWDDW